MLLTAIGSLGSINSTEARPIGDWISPTTVGWKQQDDRRKINSWWNISWSELKINRTQEMEVSLRHMHYDTVTNQPISRSLIH